MKLVFILLLIGLSSCCNHNGRRYSNGDTWIENNSFKMTCVVHSSGWRTEILSCVTPSGHEIPKNHQTTFGQTQWQCLETSPGQVTLKQNTVTGFGGGGSGFGGGGSGFGGGGFFNSDCAGGHEYGSHWTDKNIFKYRCGANGVISFVGCYIDSGELIPNGGFKVVGKYLVTCKLYEDGTAKREVTEIPSGILPPATPAPPVIIIPTGPTISPGPKSNSCNGRSSGDQWIEDTYVVMECRNGVATGVACKVPGLSQFVPLGQNVTHNGMAWYCVFEDGKYKYFSRAPKPTISPPKEVDE